LNSSYDIIPDIHGQYKKLLSLLSGIGWYLKDNVWVHSDRGRKIIFLGDFIDRGTQNRKVLSFVRNMVDSGLAFAVMGNHELNAIYFHSQNLMTQLPLRRHTQKNIEQHKSFLEEFPLGNIETNEIINWFCSLPTFIDFGSFRVVHACWSQKAVNTLRQLNNKGVFPRDFYIKNNSEMNSFYFVMELLTKGPEDLLPLNSFFTDKTGVNRYFSRLAWWRHESKSWRDLSISVPDLNKIPDIAFENWNKIDLYPKNEIPVFFGHYWMSYPPKIESQNALCLDYSAGTTGPLISYYFDPLNPKISLKNITSDSISKIQ
jgi:hypothetical protein